MREKLSTFKALFSSKRAIALTSFVAGVLVTALVVAIFFLPRSTQDEPIWIEEMPDAADALPEGPATAGQDTPDHDSASPDASDPTVSQASQPDPGVTTPSQDLANSGTVYPSKDATTPPKPATDKVLSDAEEAAERARLREINAAATETYIYDSPVTIPATLPADCERLKFSVQGLTHTNGDAQVLAEFTHATMGYRFTVVENPDLGQLSDINYQAGYNLLAVLCQNQNGSKSELTVMSYNPVETPTVIIQMNAFDEVVYATMDVAVFHLSFYSNKPLGDDVYRSNGASDSNFAWWGTSDSGDTNYKFSATSVEPLTEAGKKNRFDAAVGYILDYHSYWDASSEQVMRLRALFSSDRATFDLDTYAKSLGYAITRQSAGYRTYERDGHQIEIVAIPDAGRVIDAIVKFDGEEVTYPGIYSTRVNGLPDTIKVSGGIILTQRNHEQLDVVLSLLAHADDV